jgi:hypothetical protein
VRQTRQMKRFSSRVLVFTAILGALLGCSSLRAQTADVLVGVNASMGSLNVDQQNAILTQLHDAKVRFIRSGITADEKGIDFARRAQAQGIQIEWLVQLQYKPGAPGRPWPNAFGVWGGPPLSAADPDQFRKYFEPLLEKLEAAGVRLAGFELGNEINSAMFNADFSLPAENPAKSREFTSKIFHMIPKRGRSPKAICNISSCSRSSRKSAPGRS